MMSMLVQKCIITVTGVTWRSWQKSLLFIADSAGLFMGCCWGEDCSQLPLK